MCVQVATRMNIAGSLDHHIQRFASVRIFWYALKPTWKPMRFVKSSISRYTQNSSSFSNLLAFKDDP